MDDGSEPIEDDEILYRRVPVSTGWYGESTGLDERAFSPHKTRDVTGISISRAKYKSIEQAATGQPGKSYFIAVLRASELRRQGVEIAPRPIPGDPGHAELPELNASNRGSDRVLELERVLVQLTIRVEGPFATLPLQRE